MTEATAYDGYDRIDDPAKVYEPVQYRLRYRCNRCGHEFSKVARSLSGPNAPCPKKACRAAILEEEIQRRAENLAQVIAERAPPGHIGANMMVKAVDATAEVVMHDYGMTDLKDNLREGDTMAPKLRPDLQQAADSFFDPQKALKSSKRKKAIDALGHRALNGAFRNMAVAPSEVFPGNRGEPAMTRVG